MLWLYLGGTYSNCLRDEGIHALLGAHVDLDGRGVAARAGDFAGDGRDGGIIGLWVGRLVGQLGRVCDGLGSHDD